jgi:hypothetical protein
MYVEDEETQQYRAVRSEAGRGPSQERRRPSSGQEERGVVEPAGPSCPWVAFSSVTATTSGRICHDLVGETEKSLVKDTNSHENTPAATSLVLPNFDILFGVYSSDYIEDYKESS